MLLVLALGACRPPAAPPILGEIPPFRLVERDGEPYGSAELRGHVWVANFIFTTCPDVCPALTAQMRRLDGLLAADERPERVSISVDPARDTAAAMKAYVAAFDPRIAGLTGTPDQIATVARAYRAIYQRVGEGDDYTMDHSVAIYVMDPEGKYSTILRHSLAPAEMAAALQQLL